MYKIIKLNQKGWMKVEEKGRKGECGNGRKNFVVHREHLCETRWLMVFFLILIN
jgi:hypothetical protein